jgi:hypothetical protein
MAWPFGNGQSIFWDFDRAVLFVIDPDIPFPGYPSGLLEKSVSASESLFRETDRKYLLVFSMAYFSAVSRIWRRATGSAFFQQPARRTMGTDSEMAPLRGGFGRLASYRQE